MICPTPREDWPESWKAGYRYDLLEVFGSRSQLGYSYAYRNRFDAALELLTEVLPEGSRVLDIAAAQGNFTLALAERGYRVTWNDLRADLAGYVKLKHERGEIEYRPGNILEMAFEHRFDAVLATEVIEHAARPDRFIRQLANLVRPEGYVVVTTPNGKYLLSDLPRFSECPDPSAFESGQFRPDADGHIFLIWPDEMRRFARDADLVMEKQVFITSPLTNGHLKTHRLLPYLPRRLVRGLEIAASRLPAFLGERLMTTTAVRLRRP